MQTDKVSAEHKSLEEIRSQLQLVLLDFGLAEELTPRVRKHFISFLHMISAGNGRKAAHHMLLFSTKQVHCSTNPIKLYYTDYVYYIVLYSYYAMLHHTLLHYITIFYIILYHIILYHNIM